MDAPSTYQVTELLRLMPEGDTRVREQLARVLYDELRARAAYSLRDERPGHTLQPTALANEAWIRLVEVERVECKDRGHFFALAATCLRHILVDHARMRNASKRGGGVAQVDLEVVPEAIADCAQEFLELDTALARLEELEERKAKVVEMRYFAGLGNEDIAALLGVSQGTVERDLRLARAWLQRELNEQGHR